MKKVILDKKRWIKLHDAVSLKNLKITKVRGDFRHFYQHFISAIVGDEEIVKGVMKL